MLSARFRDRGRRMQEQLELMRALWTDEWVTFHGEFFEVVDWTSRPRPPRRIPIWLGGDSRQQLARVGGYADGWLAGAHRLPTLRDDFAHARSAAEGAGRDPERLTLAVAGVATLRAVSLGEAAERVVAAAEAGAQHVLLGVADSEGARGPDLIEEFARDYLPALRAG